MKIVYLDESDQSGKWSAVTACVIHSENIPEFRRSMVVRLRQIFERDSTTAIPFPTLHATNLPVELKDAAKIDLHRLFADLALSFFDIFRVSYPHGYLSFGISSEEKEARLQALSHLVSEIIQSVSGPKMFVFDLDISSIKTNENFYPGYTFLDSHLQMEIINQAPYLPEHQDVLGYYYGHKSDHGIAMVDFISYQLGLEQRSNPSPFQEKILLSTTSKRPRILLNRVV